MLPQNNPDRIRILFDDHRLVANAGLLLPATLARHLGLRELVDHHLDLGGAPGRANTGDKMLTLVASALAGGDCISDADALRAGGTVGVLGCVVKAPSTLGTFLRSFRWGHVRQLDRVSRQLLARAWAAGAGPGDSPLTIDLDSTICETYGLAKEGARHHGYTGARGYHPLLAIAAGTGEVLMSRLREGRAITARGAAHFLRETVGRVRYGGAKGQLTVRADSGFYAHTVVAACREMDVRFSITIRQRSGEPTPRTALPPVRVEDAHPAIVSKRDFQRARRLLGSRAPKKVNPRRASSPYLLSGIAKCETCGKAMTAAEAKSGKYTYYICHSLLKRGKGTCKTPRLNAKNFEKIIVDELRANILTESNIRDLVKLLDEEMDGVARDQRERLQTIEEELEDVKRRLARIWNHIETTDTEMADASDRIREHRERKEKLEIAAGEARALLSERRQFLDSADTIATFAAEMSEFLKTSELTETRAFVHSFVKEVEVKPGKAAIVYSIPTPEDSPIGGADAAEVALNGRVRSTVQSGGPEWTVGGTIFEMWLGSL